MVWENGQVSYKNQLQGFSNLASLIDSKLERASQEQETFGQRLEEEKIPSKNVQQNEKASGELKAAFLEIILDGLCFLTPKIIDKKEAGYVAA
jgi:magnesium chelatase subunit I